MNKMVAVLGPLVLLLTTSLACNMPAGDVIRVGVDAIIEDCQSADRALYESVSRHIGQQAETPANPATASYEVCYSRWNGEPMSARIIEGEEGGDVARFDGTYVGDEIERPLGAIIEVLDTHVTVDVLEGKLEGEITETSVVQYAHSGELPYTKTERAVQTILLEGNLEPSGLFEGGGITSASYTLLSCEPAENCKGIGATISASGGTRVSLEGSIVDGVLVGEVVNSVSGASFSFEAERRE